MEGKALETSHNYARNVRICKRITQELGFAKVEQLDQGKLLHVSESHENTQKVLSLAIKEKNARCYVRLTTG
jgi:hypothetical protein